MQWLQDPNQNSEDNVNNARRKPNKHFRKEKRKTI